MPAWCRCVKGGSAAVTVGTAGFLRAIQSQKDVSDPTAEFIFF